MLHLLVVLVPLGLASAVSPVMLTEQTVLLAGPRGRRTALPYAAGTATVLVALVAAILLLGRSVSLPSAPHLDASLDLVVGGLLLALAAALRWWPSHGRDDRRQRERMSPVAAFGFGVFSMATNITTLALVVPAAKEIAASRVVAWEGLVATSLLVTLACLPAWAPVVLESAAPRTAGSFLERVQRLVQRRGRLLVCVLVAAAGVFLLARGVIRMAGQ